MQLDRNGIFEKLVEFMQEMLEIDPADVTMESHLFNDLDLDSIDAVDLVVRLQELTGRKIPPTEFKNVRTVSDVVDCVQNILVDS